MLQLENKDSAISQVAKGFLGRSPPKPNTAVAHQMQPQDGTPLPQGSNYWGPHLNVLSEAGATQDALSERLICML